MKNTMKKLAWMTLGTCLLACCTTQKPALGQSIPQCESNRTKAQFATYTSGCYQTPTVYQVTINEMGLCEANPFSGSSFDDSTCFATFTGSQTVDVAGGASFNLTGGTSERPANGLYPYAYAKMSNLMGITGSYAISGGSTYATTTTATTTLATTTSNVSTGSAAISPVTLNSFGATCTASTSLGVSSGTLNAYLTTSDYSLASDCTSATAMVGTFTPNAPFEIDETCTGMLISFKVSNTGMQIIPSTTTGLPYRMIPGAFEPVLSLIK